MVKIKLALRERLEMAGCYPVGQVDHGRELWFTPHLNSNFALPQEVTTNVAANVVLRTAGMEEVF